MPETAASREDTAREAARFARFARHFLHRSKPNSNIAARDTYVANAERDISPTSEEWVLIEILAALPWDLRPLEAQEVLNALHCEL